LVQYGCVFPFSDDVISEGRFGYVSGPISLAVINMLRHIVEKLETEPHRF